MAGFVSNWKMVSVIWKPCLPKLITWWCVCYCRCGQQKVIIIFITSFNLEMLGFSLTLQCFARCRILRSEDCLFHVKFSKRHTGASYSFRVSSSRYWWQSEVKRVTAKGAITSGSNGLMFADNFNCRLSNNCLIVCHMKNQKRLTFDLLLEKRD